MIDIENVQHHPVVEEIVEVLCNKTQNTDKGFFRVETVYFLAKMASAMRASVVTKDRGEIPVNIYAIALANSGYGKGHSVGLLENEFLSGFKQYFMEHTLPTIADDNLRKIADRRAAARGEDPQEVYEKRVLKEYERTGAYPFTFDSGTPAAVKQLRHKLLMAGAGGINMQTDEIGSNLLSNIEILTVLLELYDQGIVKQKLTKNTSENVRSEELDGKTPTNMLLFGTPSKLFDGSLTEQAFYDFLETGFARRCHFGWGQQERKAVHQMSAKEIYERLIQPENSTTIEKWANHFTTLADPSKHGWKMYVEDDVAIRLMEYRIACEKAADALPDHEEIQKAELSHRYFKALKLAGVYAFIDESSQVEMEHLMQAIKLTEESGVAFRQILSREKAYVKLAKYIASCGVEVTHADLVESLPFYQRGHAARNEMMQLAMAWGYKQNILIKKTYSDGIEFFRGESLKETDLNELIVSYSNSVAYDYLGERVPFDQFHILTGASQENGRPMHWANHFFKDAHRADDNAIPGFNILVLDIDQGTTVDMARSLMEEYKFLLHTTKSHTDDHHRFRMILPIKYELELDEDDYREFMNNVISWLPFDVDKGPRLTRGAKWETTPNSSYFYNLEGQVLDPIPFVPKTSKNEQFHREFREIENLSNLERWFAQRIARGNRNNHMLRYALALVDGGWSLLDIQNAVHSFNDKLAEPLRRDEINSTILKTVAKKVQERDKLRKKSA